MSPHGAAPYELAVCEPDAAVVPGDNPFHLAAQRPKHPIRVLRTDQRPRHAVIDTIAGGPC